MVSEPQSRRDCEIQRVAREIMRLLEEDATEHHDKFCPEEWNDIHEKAVNLTVQHIQIKSSEKGEQDYLEWWWAQWGKQIL